MEKILKKFILLNIVINQKEPDKLFIKTAIKAFPCDIFLHNKIYFEPILENLKSLGELSTE